jgi:hypothetical protein
MLPYANGNNGNTTTIGESRDDNGTTTAAVPPSPLLLPTVNSFPLPPNPSIQIQRAEKMLDIKVKPQQNDEKQQKPNSPLRDGSLSPPNDFVRVSLKLFNVHPSQQRCIKNCKI